MTRPRTPQPPYCWQSKDTLRALSAAHSERTDKAHAIAVYVALTWFASDNECEEFSVERSKIAERAGISYRKAADVLRLLHSLGIITVKDNFIPGTKEKGPCTYTLGTPCLTSGTECLRLGTDAKQASVPRLLKNRERTEKDSSPVSAKRSSRPPQLVDEEHLAELRKIYKPDDVDRAFASMKAWLLTPKGAGKAPSKRRLNTFLRDAEPLAVKPQHADNGATDRQDIDSEAFQHFLASEYPGRDWSATNAPQRVITEFQKKQ